MPPVAALAIGGAVAGIGSAVGGAVAAGGARDAASTAADAQLQAARESIAAQERGAERAGGLFEREAGLSRQFIREGEERARADLAPVSEIGLEALQRLGQFTQPGSELENLERQTRQREISNRLAAVGLNRSGQQISELVGLETGLGSQRLAALGQLAGVGTGVQNTLAELSARTGGALSGTSALLGQQLGSTFGNLGTNIGNTLLQSGTGAAQTQLQGATLANQFRSQAIAGPFNAFQNVLGGFSNLAAGQQQQAFMQQLLGGGGQSAIAQNAFGGAGSRLLGF